MAIKANGTRKVSTSSAIAGSYGPVVITSVIVADLNYLALDDTAVLSSGGYIRILGVGFLPGYSLYLNGVAVASSTYQSSNEIRAVTPSIANGTYNLTLFNTNGTGSIYALAFSGFPTWTTGTYTNQSAIVSVQLLATGDAPLTYYLQSGSTLPTGVTLSSTGLVSGTLTGVTTPTIYTFTVLIDDLQKQTAQQTITLNVVFGDAQFKYTALLLNGETAVTPFINDASTNNLGLTIAGDTRADKFSPYTAGYYSNYFDGTGDYLSLATTPNFGFGTGNCTIECWVEPLGTQGLRSQGVLFDFRPTATVVSNQPTIYVKTDGTIFFYFAGSIQITSAAGTLINGVWSHIALVKSSGTFYLYVNGVSIGSYASVADQGTSNVLKIGYANADANPDNLFAYVSNVRVVKGTALYTSAFTPPTTPLTAVANTSLLMCQSNGLIDNSVNNFTITKGGDTIVSAAHPYNTPISVTVNTSYSTLMNGSGNYVSVAGGNAGFNFGTGDLTIEGWIYFNSGATYTLFDNRTAGTSVNISVQEYNTFLSVFIGGSSQVINSNITPTIGQWYHLAVVRISGNMKLYVNGTQAGSTYASSQNFSGVAGPVCIGGGYPTGTNSPLNGYISNVRVVNGLGVYIGNFTVPTGPLTAIQGSGTNISAITTGQTVLLTCQDSTGKDNSSSAQAVSINGTAIPVNNAYPFTQTTQTVSNLNTLGSAYFDGTGDYLTGPYNSVFDWQTSPTTIETWVYPTVFSGYKTIMAKALTVTGANDWELVLNNTGNVVFRYWTGSQQALTSTNPLVLNTWSHIAFVYDGSTIKLYINGVVAGSTASVLTAAATAAIPLQIGASYGGIESSNLVYFTGYISNVRFTKGTALYTTNFTPPTRPLTAVANTQLLTLQYNGGANNNGIIDNSSFNNIITRNGNTSQGSFSPYSQTGWSTYYNGTTDYQPLPTNSAFAIGTADFTVECWAMPTGSNLVWSQLFAGVNYGSSSDWGLYASDANTPLYPTFYFTSSGTPGNGATQTQGSQTLTGYTKLIIGQWNHIAVSRASGTARMFINGVQTGPSVNASTWSLTNVLQKSIGGGYNGNGNTLFTGYISNLRVVSGTGLYTTTFTPPTAPLTPIAGTILLTNQSSRFIDNSSNNFTLTTGGTPSVQAFSPFGSVREATPLSYSNYFAGTSSDYLTIAASGAGTLLDHTGDFTTELWIYWVGMPPAGYDNIYGNNGVNGTYVLGTSNISTVWSAPYVLRLYVTGVGAVIDGNTVLTAGQWYHIAHTRTSNVNRLFVNGVVQTNTYTDATSRTFGSAGTTIAKNSNAYVSNFRYVKGTSLYNTTFTPSTTSLTAIANTQVLTCQSTTMIDNSTNRFTLTANGDAKPKQFNPFGYTAQSATAYSPTLHGGSAYFDGTGDYLSIPPTSLFTFNGDFTIEAWVYPTVINVDNCIISRWTSSLSFIFKIVTSGRPYFAWYKGGSGTVTGTSTAVLINQWNHVAVTRIGSTVRLFVNGTLDSTTGTIAGALDNSTTAITVGSLDTTPSQVWNGYLSDVRVINGTSLYSASFTPPTSTLTNTTSTNLLLNFTNAGIIDQHSSNVLETVGNAQLSTSVKKYGNSSMYFDGTLDSLKIIDSPNINLGTGDFTLECWVYFNVVNAEMCLINKGWQSSSAYASYLIYMTSGGSLRFNASTSGSSWDIASEVVIGAMSATTWTHIAVTRSGTTYRAFINGAIVSGFTFTNAGSHAALAAQSLFIGGRADNNSSMNGYLDDVRITKGVARYTATFTPPSSALEQM